jgi:hypothetical protein
MLDQRLNLEDGNEIIHVDNSYSVPLETYTDITYNRSALPKASCLASALTNSRHSILLLGTSSRISRIVLRAPKPNKKANGMLLLPPEADIMADETNGLKKEFNP